MHINGVNKRINEVIIKGRKYGASLVFLNGQTPPPEQIKEFTQGPIGVKKPSDPKND